MKRAQKVVGKRLLQSDFGKDVVTEQTVDVKAVRALGRGCHSEPQFGLEMLHDSVVARCAGAMHFVNDDHIEFCRGKRAVVEVFDHGLHGCKDNVPIGFLLLPDENAVCVGLAHDVAVTLK